MYFWIYDVQNADELNCDFGWQKRKSIKEKIFTGLNLSIIYFFKLNVFIFSVVARRVFMTPNVAHMKNK